MLQRLFCVFLLLGPMVCSAQWVTSGSAEFDSIAKKRCHGRVFTKTEQLPTLTIPQAAFEDSLLAQLKSHGIVDLKSNVNLLFCLTSSADMISLEGISTPVASTAFLKAFHSLNRFWSPAIQNGHQVCSYVKCKIEPKDGRVALRIYQ